VYPDDLVNLVLAMLASTQTDRERLAAQLEFMDSMEIVLSSCQVNRGDSGGPLVNDDGEVVGVTFGIPGDYLDQKVAYHVSLAEVQAFLENAEHEKLLLLPDGWQLKPVLMLAEPKLLAAGDDAATPTQFLFDLDEDTPPGLLDLRNPIELVGRRRFDAEVILHYSERRRLAFYDTDDDREFDVILLDNDTDPSADRQYTRVEDGTWQVEEGADRPWFDPSLLKQRRLKKTFVELVEKYDLG
jgi:serine protease Do